MFCHHCGKEIIANANFCSICGTKIQSASEDLVEQEAVWGVLDSMTEIEEVNTFIDESAKWSGVHEASATNTSPTVNKQQIERKTYKAGAVGLVIQYEKVDDVTKYWYENTKGNRVSDYYEFVSLRMHGGIFATQKGGKWGYMKLEDDQVKPITPFMFDYAHDFQYKEEKDDEEFDTSINAKSIARVGYKGMSCLLSNSLTLYEIEKTLSRREPVSWGRIVGAIAFAAIIVPFFIWLFVFDKSESSSAIFSFLQPYFTAPVIIIISIIIALIGIIIAFTSREIIPEERTLNKLGDIKDL